MIFSKIYFRYLFMRLLVPFMTCLLACTVIWIMADLYGNIDDFLEHRVSPLLILRFYSLQIPNMLVQVLPATILFSTLWTLMSLNRRCELVAFQSGGMAPFWLFTPFVLFAAIWVVILAVDLNWFASEAQVTRERLLQQVKGQNARSNVFENLPYVDSLNNRVWFFQTLNTNENKARGVEILQRDENGRDMFKYFAREGRFTGDFWRLSGVLKIVFNGKGGVQDQKLYEELDLPDITTPPRQLSLIVSQPDQLTVRQLSQYIESSTATEEHLAGYRTEWWYRVLYPFSLLVLLLFALQQGARTDRRGAAAGVAWAIGTLLAFVMVMNVFMTAGRFNRLPPFIAVIATELIFGALGLYLLALSNGWYWQALEEGKKLYAKYLSEPEQDAQP